ncbi:DUF4178 domain-containing protein [bacterium]|nr:DUF4178 domain-containing protein [bacterium]
MYILIYGIVILAVVAFIIPMSSGLLASLGLIFTVVLIIALIRRNAELKEKCKENDYGDSLIIQNVREGGVIKLANVEGYNEDLELKVIGRNLYTEGDYSWFELECVRPDGEKVWIDVDDDDELIVSVVIKKLNLADLNFSNSLETIDENENGSVSLKDSHSGKYYYVDSGDAIFYKHCDDRKPEKLYYWDFRNNNHFISVEKWKSSDTKSDYEYFYSQIIKPHSITVYSTGNKESK